MRVILYLLAMALMMGCSPKSGGTETYGGGVSASAPAAQTELDKCKADAHCAPCTFKSDGDSCPVTFDIDYKSRDICSVLVLDRIYVATHKDFGTGKSFGGTVELRIKDTHVINDVTFSDTSSPWKKQKPSDPTNSFPLSIDSGATGDTPGDYKFTVTISPKGKNEPCTTKDPVIGNGLY
jgi:hypothetical protein